MTRVLHLLDMPAPSARPSTLAQLALVIRAASDYEHVVMLIGTAAHERLAQHLGISHLYRIAAPFHRAVLALPTLRRQVKRMGRPGLVHAWSPGAAQAARVICRGLALANESAFAPSVDSDLIDGSVRRTLRERWGVGEQTPIVALLDAQGNRSPAMWGAVGVGLARECLAQEVVEDTLPTLLLHPNAPGLSKTLAMIREVGWRGGLIQEAGLTEPWRVLPAADVALVHRSADGGCAALWAAACGVPVIAERGGSVTDMLGERGGALLVEPDTPREAGDHMLRLIREPAAGQALAELAHRIVDEHYTLEATAASLRRVYESAI